jgi:hypothetical protein
MKKTATINLTLEIDNLIAMLLQLYTNLNLELVHLHARQLKPVVYCQKKTVVCSPLFEGSAEG